MARVVIPVTDVTRAGVAFPSAVTADATNDHYVTGVNNTGDWYLHIVSTDAGSQTVEIVANPDLTNDGLTVSNLSITVAAGATRIAGPFKPRTFRQGADSNNVYINPSVSTTLTFRAIRLAATP